MKGLNTHACVESSIHRNTLKIRTLRIHTGVYHKLSTQLNIIRIITFGEGFIFRADLRRI